MFTKRMMYLFVLRRRIDWKQLYSSHLGLHAIFKYMNCTLPLSFIVWKSKEMDREKFICKKCSFTTERLRKLNTHTKKIHVIHNVSNSTNSSDKKQRSAPQNGFYTKETFDEILDEMESRDPPVNIRIVITATMTKPSETKRRKKKPAKHSFEFMIVDATELSSWNVENERTVRH